MTYDAIIVVSPFARLETPPAGPSVLVAELREKGISAGVYYANLKLASLIGVRLYETVWGDLINAASLSLDEALFNVWTADARALPGVAERAADELMKRRERSLVGMSSQLTERELGKLRTGVAESLIKIPDFLDQALDDLMRLKPRIVGFTTLLSQLTCAMALAKGIKETEPDTLTVLGGPGASSPMGEAIAEATGDFDFIFSGEADSEFPRFVADYLNSGLLPAERVIECDPMPDLDAAPAPTYDDYFRQLGATLEYAGEKSDIPHALFLESSRGCWWGARRRCAFCGADSITPVVRSKSPEKVIGEIHAITSAYGISRLMTADVLLPTEYLETLFPLLKDDGRNDFGISYAVRAGLKESDLKLMVQAGVYQIVCGIESFSTPMLRRMNKGTSAMQNLCLLRDCVSCGLDVMYGVLTSIPGDEAESYQSMLELIPKIEHFVAPSYFSPVHLYRSSSYHSEPASHGIQPLRPRPEYRRIFGDDPQLDQIAYVFEADYKSAYREDQSLRESFASVVAQWRRCWTQEPSMPLLRKVWSIQGVCIIQDTRRCRLEPYYVADDEDLELLDHLARPRLKSELETVGQAKLQSLVERSFVIEHEGYLLSVVTDPSIGQDLKSAATPG